ncbi:MAG: hypothetical protein AAF449_23905 [Myxococcota bacterium]
MRGIGLHAALCGFWVAISVSTVSRSTAAQSIEPTDANRVAMAGLTGRRGRGIAKLIVRSLQDEKIDARLMDDWQEGANDDRKSWSQVASDLKLAAWIEGRLLRKKRRWKLDITIRRGLDTVVLGKLRRKAKTIDELRTQVQSGVVDQLTAILNDNVVSDVPKSESLLPVPKESFERIEPPAPYSESSWAFTS